jgi:hypothetical protein
MLVHKFCVAAIAAIITGFAAAAWVHAAEANRTQYLTFSSRGALPGVTLKSGTYIFEIPEPDAAPDIVRVLSRDRKTVFMTAYTRSVGRPAGIPLTQLVSLAEVAPNQPVPIITWWSDEGRGRQFIY